MQFHKQLNQHSPENRQVGDCFRTCLACLLDLSPQDVPHFVELHREENNSYETPAMRAHINSWLAERNLAIVDIVYEMGHAPLEQLLNFLGEFNGDDICYLVAGLGYTFPHICIYRGNKLLWDPSPNGNGIQSPINGHYVVSFLVPLFMRYNP